MQKKAKVHKNSMKIQNKYHMKSFNPLKILEITFLKGYSHTVTQSDVKLHKRMVI